MNGKGCMMSKTQTINKIKGKKKKWSVALGHHHPMLGLRVWMHSRTHGLCELYPRSDLPESLAVLVPLISCCSVLPGAQLQVQAMDAQGEH